MRWLQVATPLLLVGAAIAVARVEPLRRVLLPPEPTAEAKLRMVLPEVEIDPTSAEAALAEIGRKAGVKFEYPQGLLGRGSSPYAGSEHAEVIRLRNVTVAEVVKHALAQVAAEEPRVSPVGDKIVITPSNGSEPSYVIRAYDIRDLLPPAGRPSEKPPLPPEYQRGPEQSSRQERIEDVLIFVVNGPHGPERYRPNGTSAPERVTEMAGFIVVVGTSRTQAEVARSIDMLRFSWRDGGQHP